MKELLFSICQDKLFVRIFFLFVATLFIVLLLALGENSRQIVFERKKVTDKQNQTDKLKSVTRWYLATRKAKRKRGRENNANNK